MKSVVIYYSQTGGTEKVAKAIRSGIESVTEQCAIVKLGPASEIRKMDMKSLLKYDLIWIGAPCHASREPANVAIFMTIQAGLARKSTPQDWGQNSPRPLNCPGGGQPLRSGSYSLAFAPTI